MCNNLYLYIKYTDGELEVSCLSVPGLCSVVLNGLKQFLLPSDVFVAVDTFSGNFLSVGEGNSS